MMCGNCGARVAKIDLKCPLCGVTLPRMKKEKPLEVGDKVCLRSHSTQVRTIKSMKNTQDEYGHQVMVLELQNEDGYTSRIPAGFVRRVETVKEP